VRRRVSIDFTVPETAPVVVLGDTSYRVLPLTIMRRKSLVNFDLRDEVDRSVPLLGLRQNQAITLALAEAWACTVARVDQPPVEVREFLAAIVSGTQETMMTAYHDVRARAQEGETQDAVVDLFRCRLFSRLLERLTEDFVMFALVPDEQPSRRVFKFRYDEPLSRRYREPKSPDNGFSGTPPPVRWWNLQPVLVALGWRPARIRFPTPAAENAYSYHFEVHAPEGTEIVSAQILAGRPGGDETGASRRPSVDYVTGRFSSIDLHVVDVERGSISRAQVDLRVALDSWLVLAVGTALLTVGALCWAASRVGHLAVSGGPSLDRSAASALFITFAAAMAVILWRPPAHRMDMRLLSKVGLLAYTPPLVLLMAAALLVFENAARLQDHLLWLVAPASLVAVVLTVTAVCTARDAFREHVLSPWEQGRHVDSIARAGHERGEHCATFAAANAHLRFDTPAIKVASAESDSAIPLSLDSRLADRMRRRIAASLRERFTECASSAGRN
jgi:hypothetical protein